MAVHAGYSDMPESARGYSVALGNFDGVHPGHRAVIDAARIDAHPLGVATFEPPPRAYFRPNDPPFRIYRPARRNARLIELGADAVFELPFNSDMAGMTDEEFCRRVLHEGLGVAHVAVGFDFRFGRGRMGDAARLSSLGRSLGFDVTIVEKVEGPDAAKASSTGIREALIAGDPQKAAAMLGHAWIADGTVERGEQRGRTIGFPTANLHLGELIHPRHGVYAVRARIDRTGDWLPGVANFGRTPTTGIRDPLLETFIFDFERDIYGHFMEVELHHFLRPELHFPSLEEMVEQMKKDSADAKRLLAG
ncbi:riboflavin biosynthesis protein RibF [Henriciella mobilis]|uniref:Riboflavin biosynthesis protein n=1 Tax=Henriciella mobilis TaxID=2305467 RepID=A0A399RMZ8_9PROT|nr:riboflavin biosynthesis protein RibF [Henriciella mobilis]RIJ16050.1 riboflavin biosynthesis protein RibF [Henriciella mobilis]RIJ23039.1 riboflavin biosynthesis protein RibF [Henriciella mobilis]RIJ32578.1 riboflavin biosynthesis protein RibF [Henriciella mobilis]